MTSTADAPANVSVAELMELHFDPVGGSPYWLERRNELRFDPLKEIRTLEDLVRFGIFPEDDLRKRPALHFVPKRFHPRVRDFVLSETGGATGKPKRVYFSAEEFRAGFITPFLDVARSVGWPEGAQWLYLGPSGPHIIGKVIYPICRALNSPAPLEIDFDPRWARRLTPGSLARERYLDHLAGQGIDILNREPVEVLFATPPLLERLAQKIPDETRLRIRGVHYGGMALDPDRYLRFRREVFPHAVHLSGYGNSLVGVAFEATSEERGMLQYFPSAARHRIRLIPVGEGSPEQNLDVNVGFGERGRVLVSRLDSTCFIPNLLERDVAIRVQTSPEAAALGWHFPGIENPQSIDRTDTANANARGFY